MCFKKYQPIIESAGKMNTGASFRLVEPVTILRTISSTIYRTIYNNIVRYNIIIIALVFEEK